MLRPERTTTDSPGRSPGKDQVIESSESPIGASLQIGLMIFHSRHHSQHAVLGGRVAVPSGPAGSDQTI